MREVWPSMVLAFPVAIYAGAKVLGSAPASQAGFAGMFVVMLILAILSAFPYERVLLWAAGAQLFATAFILGALYFALGFGVQLLAGSLLAAPALLVGYSVRPGPLGWRLFAFAFALAIGLGLLAADQGLTSSGVVVSAGELIREFISLNITQALGLYGLLASTGGVIPLRDFFDPDFIVLAAIAGAGLLFTSLRPQTAWGDLLPSAGAMTSFLAMEEAPVDLGPDLASTLEGRSAPEPASGIPPGVPGLLGGCLAAVLAIAAAFVSPGVTLLLIATGVVAALGFTIAVMRRTLPAHP